MSFFTPFPSVASLHPVALSQANRKLRADLSGRGLTRGEATSDPTDLYMAEVKLGKALDQPSALPLPIARSLPTLVVWLSSQPRRKTIERLEQRIRAGHIPIGRRLFWALACVHAMKPDWSRFLRNELHAMPPRTRRRIAGGRLRDNAFDRPGQLADHLADDAVRSGAGLNGVQKVARAAAGTPLMEAVWDRVLSPAAAPWIAAHPMGELQRFLDANRDSVRIGQVGRLLFEPLMFAGLTPGDVQPGRTCATLCEAIGRAMPTSKKHAAWVALGEAGARVLRWWQMQAELRRFFEEWNADPRRGKYWLSLIDGIQDVEPFEGPNALAMRIGDYWFVEFGRHNNSAYAYADALWQSEARRRQRATKEQDLKVLGGVPASRQPHRAIHTSNWEDQFDHWISRLTGRRIERRR